MTGKVSSNALGGAGLLQQWLRELLECGFGLRV